MDAIVEHIGEVVGNHAGLRDLDHKAIRNLPLSGTNPES